MKKVSIFDSKRIVELSCWKMPKSDSWYPVLVYSGELPSQEHELGQELLQLQFLFEELFEYFPSSRRLIWVLDELKPVSAIEEFLCKVENHFFKTIHLVGYDINNSGFDCVNSIETAIEQIIILDRKNRFDGGAGLTSSKTLINNIHYDKFEIQQAELLTIDLTTYNFEGKHVGLFKISDDYGAGSENFKEGQIVARRMNQFDRKYSFDYLIIDARELVYRWGDDLKLYPRRFRFLNLAEKDYDSLILIVTDGQYQNDQFRYLLKENDKRIVNSLEEAEKRITELNKKYG